MKPVVSLDELELRDGGNGDAFKAKIASFGWQIGALKLGAMLHVVEPGEKAYPFHAHHQIEEMFVILEGEGAYRFGDKEYAVKAGDVCGAPCGGAEHAHQIRNTGNVPLKYLGVSTMAETEVVEYPDSGKFAVISRYDWNNPDAGGIRHVARAEDTRDYFEGEK